jgi:hypothetical protein
MPGILHKLALFILAIHAAAKNSALSRKRLEMLKKPGLVALLVGITFSAPVLAATNIAPQNRVFSTTEQPSSTLRHFAPIQVFLYLEPFAVRKEIVMRLSDLERWVDLGLEDSAMIEADERSDVLQTISRFLARHQPVTLDGKSADPIPDRAVFLTPGPENLSVVEPGIDIDADSAVVGVIFVHPSALLPDKATLTWDMFDGHIEQVPAWMIDEAGSFKVLLEPGRADLEWHNRLSHQATPALIALPLPTSSLAHWLYALRWWSLGVVVVALTLWGRSQGRYSAVVALSGLFVLGCSLVVGKPPVLSGAAVEQIVSGLLRNVYHAFDYQVEVDIFDTLEHSVSSEQLADIYLQISGSLELDNQGGARARVRSLEVQDIEVLSGVDPQAFRADVTWLANGSVGHWGFVYTHDKHYRATLDIRIVDNRWKLAGMEVHNEKRL